MILETMIFDDTKKGNVSLVSILLIQNNYYLIYHVYSQKS